MKSDIKSEKKPGIEPTAGVDLLAEAEAKAEDPTSRYVRPISEQQKGTMPVEDVPSETDLITWDESEDVYRPTYVEAADFIETLPLATKPEIQSHTAYIFIERTAYDRMQLHVRTNLSVELGGLLYGQAFLDPNQSIYLLVIHAALAAQDAVETATSLTYTAAAWQAITPQLQELNADWTLIGSYHSHPGLGVFLSETDLATQEDIFAQDWQIAVVIDPIAKQTGFFVGKDGAVCDHWHILSE